MRKVLNSVTGGETSNFMKLIFFFWMPTDCAGCVDMHGCVDMQAVVQGVSTCKADTAVTET